MGFEVSSNPNHSVRNKKKKKKVRIPRVFTSHVELGLNCKGEAKHWDSVAGTWSERKQPWVAPWALQD